LTDTTSNNNRNTQPHAESTSSREDLKLLSVNEGSKILQIRSESVKKLIKEGRIEVIIIGKRIKIPMISLKKFIDQNAKIISDELNEEYLSSSKCYINDKVDSIIKKHIRRK